MGWKAVSGMMLTLLFVGMLTLAFNVQPVRSEPRIWTVDDDGPADFHTIQEAINAASDEDTIFVCSGVYNENVTVNKTLSLIGQDRNTTIIDGSGIDNHFTLGIIEIIANNVTISGFTIRIPVYGQYGIGIRASFAHIMGNAVTGSNYTTGIAIGGYGNIIAGNNITGNHRCGILSMGLGDTISRNIISNNGYGIMLALAENNTISGNIIINNGAAIWLRLDTLGNTIVDNDIANNSFCFDFFLCNTSNNDTIYHNNFINNKHLVANLEPRSNPAWDNGYPSGGNYWSDYNGTDLYSGPYQNETGSDGIGDTPYVIFAEINAQDNYPLMIPNTPTYDLAVLNVTASKTLVGQGYCLPIEITIENQGSCTELLFVTAYANTTTIAESGPLTLAPGKQTKLIMLGDTTDVAKGNHTITAYVHPVPGETDTLDNNFTDSWILVTIPGDVNGDRMVDMADKDLINYYFGEPCSAYPNADVNCDCTIDMADIDLFNFHFGESW